MDISGISVRPAVGADYEAVLAINRHVYDDMDYLPVMYHWMVHTSNNFPLVAELDGKVVCFINYYMIDDKTALTMAGRRSSAVKGIEVPKIIKEFARPYINKMYPSFNRELSGARTYPNYTDRISRSGGQIGYRWKIETNKFPSAALESALEAYPQNAQQLRVSTLSHADITRLSNGIASILRKYGNFLVYAPTWRIVFATSESVRIASHLCDIRVTMNTAGEIQSVSFSSVIATKTGVTGQCFYYGDNAADALAHSHVFYKSLLMKCHLGSNRCASIVHFPVSLPNIDSIINFHNSFGDRPKSPGDMITDAFVVVGPKL